MGVSIDGSRILWTHVPYTVHGESGCSQPLDLGDQWLKLMVWNQFKTGTLYRGIDKQKKKESKGQLASYVQRVYGLT
jgi:hypothetical protein